VSHQEKETPTTSRREWALGRREFLVLGTAAAAGAAATSLRAGTIATIATPTGGAILSVGFAGQLDAGAPLLAAARFRQADAEFGRSGARVTVLGAWRPDAVAGEPVSFRLAAFFPHVGPDGRAPFLAWSQAFDLRGASHGKSVAFNVPLDEDGTLPISLERVDLTPSRFATLFARTVSPARSAVLPNLTALDASGNVCRLTSGCTGDVRLREGTYFIALRRSNADRAPNWSSISVEAADLRSGGRPVLFEYVALSVRHATA